MFAHNYWESFENVNEHFDKFASLSSYLVDKSKTRQGKDSNESYVCYKFAEAFTRCSSLLTHNRTVYIQFELVSRYANFIQKIMFETLCIKFIVL